MDKIPYCDDSANSLKSYSRNFVLSIKLSKQFGFPEMYTR